MAERQHVVKQGECISSLGKHYNWCNPRSLYEAPKNLELRTRRPNPDVLYPGDRVIIPDKKPKQESGETEQRHRFQLKKTPTFLRLRLHKDEDVPFANCQYRIDIDGAKQDGITDGEGLLEHEIPADAKKATLIFKGRSVELMLGYLDPVEEVSGVQARLNNLGYDSGAIDGIQGPITTAAVKAFQRDQGIEVDGIVGPITRQYLIDAYGGT